MSDDRIYRKHGMLFTGAMVRAFLRERNPKRQTRRLPNSMNCYIDGSRNRRLFKELDFAHKNVVVDAGPSPAGNAGPYLHVPNRDGDTTHRVYPAFQPGDEIWVRETWKPAFTDGSGTAFKADRGDKIDAGKWHSPIHLPYARARIRLKVERLRIERLHRIVRDDAKAEGLSEITKDGGRTWKWGIPDRDGLPGNEDDGWHWQEWCVDPCMAYFNLWEKINGAASLEANPWLFVLDLKPTGEVT